MSWFEKVIDSLYSGPGGSFPRVSALCLGGAFAVFQKRGSSFVLIEGGAMGTGMYDFLEKSPDSWSSVFQRGAVRVSLDRGAVWVAIDRISGPGYLVVADLDPAAGDAGGMLRLALVSDLVSSNPVESELERLPVWLGPVLGDALGRPSPLLILSEEGSGVDQFVAGLIGAREARSRAEYFNPGRLSEAVQLRELFGDPAGARLGGAGASTPLLQRGADVVVIREAGSLSMQVQLRLNAIIDGAHPFWIFESSRNIEAMAQGGEFLPALYERLGKNRIVLPPVRSCREELPAEVVRMLGHLEIRYRRKMALSDEAMESLMRYDWPGNYDELKSVLESTFLMCSGDVIGVDDLRIAPWEFVDDWGDLNMRKRIEEMERSLIMKAFALHSGNQVHMARALGVSRGSLQYKMQKYGLTD